MNDLIAAVNFGAQLLDSKQPGWAERINLESLDLTHYKYCILGQLYGTYGEGISELGWDIPFSHGFAVKLIHDYTFRGHPTDYVYLHNLWRDAILGRQA